MRRLALALALCACACIALAVPAAAAPIDPGRAVTLTAATAVQAPASVLPATATGGTVVLPASPSAVGDRPADGTHSKHLGIIDLGRDASFDLATFGARQLLKPAATISP